MEMVSLDLTSKRCDGPANYTLTHTLTHTLWLGKNLPNSLTSFTLYHFFFFFSDWEVSLLGGEKKKKNGSSNKDLYKKKIETFAKADDFFPRSDGNVGVCFSTWLDKL